MVDVAGLNGVLLEVESTLRTGGVGGSELFAVGKGENFWLLFPRVTKIHKYGNRTIYIFNLPGNVFQYLSLF